MNKSSFENILLEYGFDPTKYSQSISSYEYRVWISSNNDMVLKIVSEFPEWTPKIMLLAAVNGWIWKYEEQLSLAEIDELKSAIDAINSHQFKIRTRWVGFFSLRKVLTIRGICNNYLLKKYGKSPS